MLRPRDPQLAIKGLSIRNWRDPKKNNKTRPNQEDGRSHHEPTHYVHRYPAIWHCHYLVTTPGQWPLVAWPRERESHHEPALSSLRRYQWVTLSALVTKPRQCPLVRPWSKKERKAIDKKIKAIKGLEKMHLWRVQLASYKGTHRQHLPLVLLWLDIPKTISPYKTWLEWSSEETFHLLWVLAQ